MFGVAMLTGAMLTAALLVSAGTGLRALFPADALVTVGKVLIAAVATSFSFARLLRVKLRVPSSRWQVPTDWRGLGKNGYAVGFGFALGIGFLTLNTTIELYIVSIWAALVAPSGQAFEVMAVFAGARWLPAALLAAAGLFLPSRLSGLQPSSARLIGMMIGKLRWPRIIALGIAAAAAGVAILE
jgi:hypothetical protein